MSHRYDDDPRLTAYVLGELEPADTAEVERLLAASAEARAAVEEIRGITEELTTHLQAEPMPALTASHRETVMSEPKTTPPGKAAVVMRSGNSWTVLITASLMLLIGGALVVNSSRNTEQGLRTADNSAANNRGAKRNTSFDDVSELTDARRANSPLHRMRTDLASNDDSSSGKSTRTGTPKPAVGLQTQPGKQQKQQGQQGGAKKHAKKPSSLSGRARRSASSFRTSPATTPETTQRLYSSRRGSIAGLAIPGQNLKAGGYRLTRRGQINGHVPGKGEGWQMRPGTGIGGGGAPGYGYFFDDELNGRPRSRRGFADRDAKGDRSKQLLKELKRPLKPVTKPQAEPQVDSRVSGGNGKPGAFRAAPDEQKNAGKDETARRTAATVQWYQPKDVAAVRKQVAKRFDQLAKANPSRQLAILRVKERLNTRLTQVQQQITQLERSGRKVPVIAGNTVVAQVVRDEVQNLDVNGDGRADFGNESYDTIVENEFLTPLANPLSTFSIDVDTASYSNVRRFISRGHLPPRDAVRIEELVNYFRYDYPQPKSSKEPFSVTLEAGLCPWNPKHRLVLVGLKGREIPHDERPASNLVFLIDVSGSMKSTRKLPLVKLALEMLVDQMRAKDRISIVTYSNTARVALEPTPGDEKNTILSAIHSLNAGGSTNGAAGIQLAYTQAHKAFRKQGANRVILCTDGDFNVGVSSDNELVKLIQTKAKSGVFLSIFGFGMGNLKDSKLEKLSNKGNGNYGYIDGYREAKKVFIEELSGTLYTIAKDVKIQVEFNPAQVASYRLIGYENRLMAAQDFNDDTKDAGEIGAGHTVTALYEIVPKADAKKPAVDDLKYQKRVNVTPGDPASHELLTVKLRYKQPDADTSTKREFPLKDNTGNPQQTPSENFDFAAAVAMYGLLLRDSKYAGSANLDLVRELAVGAMGKDAEGHRSEFVQLVDKTRSLVARKLRQPVAAPRGGTPAGDARK